MFHFPTSFPPPRTRKILSFLLAFLCLRSFRVTRMTTRRVPVSRRSFSARAKGQWKQIGNIYRASFPEVGSTVGEENSLARAWALGQCTDASWLRARPGSHHCDSSEFPLPDKSWWCTWSWSPSWLLCSSCLLMKALICRTDGRSKTCISASETVGEGKMRKRKNWRGSRRREMTLR